MKKRTLALALALGCVFMSPTLSYGEENAEAEAVSETEEDSGMGDLYGVWIIDQSVDEFGDKTEGDAPVLKTPITGDFSNTATASSTLSGALFIQKVSQKYVAAFRLLEYGNTPATYLSSEEDELILKTKVGDEVKEFNLFGTAPNGDLYLGALNDEDGNWFVDTLCGGNDIKCVIYIGSSKYNFTISSNGFSDACTAAGFGSLVTKSKLSASAATLYEYMKANEKEIQDNYYQHEYYKDADRVIDIAATEDNDIPYIMVYETVYYDQDDKTQQSIIFLHESASSVQLYSNIGSDEMDGSVKASFEPATFKENTTLTQYYDLEGNPKDASDAVVEYWNTHNAALLDALADYLSTTDCGLTLEDFGFAE